MAGGPPSPSALSTLITAHPPSLALAAQTLHTLQHAHSWTDLTIHPSPPHPVPLISGLPPKRIYVHPEDQIAELQRGVREEDIRVEREYVLPTRRGERWTLRRLAGVFDGLDVGEPEGENEVVKGGERREKRLLLAVVGEDSTVSFYVVHDGVVKPRQN